MEKIDYSLLHQLKQDSNNKNIKSKENHKAMLQFFYSQNNIFKYIKANFYVYELALWIKSKTNYIERKNSKNTTNYSPRNILYIDLGHNIGSELSYEHVCIVIKAEYDKLFVVPCSSSRVNRAINPKTNNLFPEYILGETTDGFSKKTVLLINEAKWLSKNRVISNTGKSISKTLFKTIYDETFNYIFKPKQRQIEVLEKIKNEQKNIINDLTKDNLLKEKEIEVLKTELKELKENLENLKK